MLCQIHVPDSELELLTRKLDLVRLPSFHVDWRDDNGIDPKGVADIVRFWRDTYDWRAEEAKLNELPQFKTPIDVDDGFGTIDLHFVHSTASAANATPVLFLHGWPGSFIEISKGLHLLTEAGYHVVAPSLPGYGFSSYTEKACRGVSEADAEARVQELRSPRWRLGSGHCPHNGTYVS